VWVVGILISSIPFFPPLNREWKFYSQADVCIPLPISHRAFPGRPYSFGVMIILNLILFLSIGVDQSAIYATIRSDTMAIGQDSRRQQNASIARRLIMIAVTDFLCWFPVGLLGILANLNVPITKNANVVLVTYVIPLNPAFNPLVYTLNSILEQRRRNKEQRLLTWIRTKHAIP
jgi:hypothetical protein